MPTSILSHPKLSDKIKGFCKIARAAGYKLVWIDSACIDKSSSAELAEAINSMFELYRLADICYVYLTDVPHGKEGLQDSTSAFQLSRWHRRGWTLQELLAPKDVVFLSSSWTFLGTKCSLVLALRAATDIDCQILLGTVPLSSVSVARKMSWAAYRETTRVEDEAYSLLGIFGVHLSPIYGEGRNAFLRLQEEIIKTVPDQSIFAWGTGCTVESIGSAYTALQSGLRLRHGTPTGILASSPREFALSGDVEPISPSVFSALVTGQMSQPTEAFSPSHEVPSLYSVVTPEGVRINMLTIDLTKLPDIYAAIMSTLLHDNTPSLAGASNHSLLPGRAHTLAVLRCTDARKRLITLPLFQAPSDVDTRKGTPIATHMKCRYSCRHTSPYRVVRLQGGPLHAARNHLSRAPIELSLLHHSVISSRTTNESLQVTREGHQLLYTSTWFRQATARPSPAHGPKAFLRLAASCEQRLRVLGFAVSPLVVRSGTLMEPMVAETSIFFSQYNSAKPMKVSGEPLRITVTVYTSGRSDKEIIPDQGSDDVLRWGSDSDTTPSIKFAISRAHLEAGFTDGSHITAVGNVGRLPNRVVAQAEFALPARWCGARRPSGDAFDFDESRLLRLAVECPVLEQYAPVIAELWLELSIDLSSPLVDLNAPLSDRVVPVRA